MKRLLALTALGVALGLTACGYPANDGRIHLGGGDSVTRPQVHVEICPPYCGTGGQR